MLGYVVEIEPEVRRSWTHYPIFNRRSVMGEHVRWERCPGRNGEAVVPATTRRMEDTLFLGTS